MVESLQQNLQKSSVKIFVLLVRQPHYVFAHQGEDPQLFVWLSEYSCPRAITVECQQTLLITSLQSLSYLGSLQAYPGSKLDGCALFVTDPFSAYSNTMQIHTFTKPRHNFCTNHRI